MSKTIELSSPIAGQNGVKITAITGGAGNVGEIIAKRRAACGGYLNAAATFSGRF